MTGLTAAESPHERPRSQLCADLQLQASTGDTELIAELVRAIAHASTAGTSAVAEELLIDRVMTFLIPACRGASASELRESVLETAATLASLGDLIQTSDGSWVSGVTFAVDRSPAQPHLLISGLPLRRFDATTRPRIVVDGYLRHLAAPINLPVLTVEQWIGNDTGPLDRWTDEILGSDGLNPVPQLLFDTAAFSFYRPGSASTAATPAQRWTPTDDALTGRALMRIQQPPNSVRFAIAQMKAGRLISFRHIHHDDARRLTFGLDVKHHRTAALTQVRADGSVTLSLDRPAPYRETRLLALLSTSFSPGRWTVPTDAVQSVVEILGVMGMQRTSRAATRKQPSS